MSTTLIFDVDGLDTPITLRRPGWAEFSGWLDAFLADHLGDANNNLSVSCALTPAAGELSSIFEDGFGFLPGELAGALLEAAGLPGGMAGLGAVFPLLSLKEVLALSEDAPPQALLDEARKRTRRPFFARTPFGWWALKPPGSAEASAYEDALTAALQGKGSRVGPVRTLVLSCVLSPDPEVVKNHIEEQPGIAYLVGRSLRRAGGEGKAIARVSG